MTNRKAARTGRSSLLVAAGLACILAVGGLLLWDRQREQAQDRTVTSFRHIHGLVADPARPGALWLASHEGLLRYEESEGWFRVGQGRPDLMGFTVSAGAPDLLFSSGHPGPGVTLPNPMGLVVSSDAGESWQPVSLAGEVDFHALAVSAADPRLLFGWHGQFFRTEDQGATWQRFSPPALTGEGSAPLQFAAHPTDRDTVLAATLGGLQVSTDRGDTWAPVLAGPVTAVAYVHGEPERILAYHLDQGLVASSDGGRTWKPLDYRVPGEDAVAFIAPDFADGQTCHLGTFTGNVVRTRDGGRTWQPVAEQGRLLGNQTGRREAGRSAAAGLRGPQDASRWSNQVASAGSGQIRNRPSSSGRRAWWYLR